ncbi:uncharacterized protein SPSC_00576 [Sporisorium scitamineum]|uniref:AB hydrolase-1 domain-containing protein n=1 Tax=Sporisorium scitamineum TaxID=49012 RepID=A0A0F7S2T8_9BASI|nr:hypothetical protein [Sporisorium scitamineum]CDU21946.1 uncharacterized protein SPSC_00576 [Sporisorium scitamineum]
MVRLTFLTLSSALLFAFASALPQTTFPDANLPVPYTDSSTDAPTHAPTDDSKEPLKPRQTLPAGPDGATLIQFKGCRNTPYTIPVFVNKNYPITGSTDASVAWIVQHGSGRNFDAYFTSLRAVVGDEGIIIAPNFYASTDTGKKAKWYQPTENLAWNVNDWNNGADAVAPSGVKPCSSLDVYDSFVELLADRSKFPNLRSVFAVGHSSGASMLAKYGMFKPDTKFRYVLANSPSMPYFTDARPDAPTGCSNFSYWGYGFDGPLPRYVQLNNPGAIGAFHNWIGQDITLMTADLDTYKADPAGDQTCPVQAQGGQNRRDRGYAWWAYINLLSGTTTDVSDFYGYQAFRNQGVTSLNPAKFGARYCVVDRVGHDNAKMFASDCGRAAIKGEDMLQPGPGPIRPE